MNQGREPRPGSCTLSRIVSYVVLAGTFAACGGGGGGGGVSTPTTPTTPTTQLFTLSGVVTEGPATSGSQGYYQGNIGNPAPGLGLTSSSNVADPVHAAAVGDLVAGAVVLITDGPHLGKSATTGTDGSYQIVGVSGGNSAIIGSRL